ncbi:M14 family zinc carboxypeptidase [Candidatus Marinimicrobia bacterium]|nr:M14 family zinc carboxypeptidase [Candidatus Neomarinimicrobiota bacterium]
MYLFIIILISCLFPLSERYHTFYEIQDKLVEWDSEFSSNENPWPQYPDSGIIYQLYEIGVSTNDSLPIYAVKLSYNADQENDKAKVLILGQCHAEEIYGVEIAMELIDWLLHPNANYPVGYSDRQLALQNTEIWVVPTYNPEGLLTVHGDEIQGEWIQDEYFRKNKNDINANQIFDYISGPGNDSDGVDLNRNYDFNWFFGDDEYDLDYGCSSNPGYISNFDYYRGGSPFSENEVQAIRDLALEKNFLLSIAYHSSRSGCVSEKVIYPWLWTDEKSSPDFVSIDKLGRDIASFLPTQDGITTYLPSGSISRRGNAHDWFYSQTGCIQYLIEVGTSSIQTDDVEIIENTIDKNLVGAFHLINRASGNNSGALGAEKHLITGIVTDFISGEILDSEIKILEMDASMIEPRMTDSFGRYRRLLHPGTFTLEVSSKGYETYIEENIVPSSSSFVIRDVQLSPLEEYQLTFNFSYPEFYDQNNSLKLSYSDKWGRVDLDIQSGSTISLFEGYYDIVITDGLSNFIMPVSEQVYIGGNTTLDYNLNWSKVLYSGIKADDWLIQSGDWFIDQKIKTQSSALYSNDYYSAIQLDSNLYANNSIAAILDLKYELEWDKDFFDLAFSSVVDDFYESSSISGHNYKSNNELIFLSLFNQGNTSFELSMSTDETLNYRGVIINSLQILTDSENNCEYGDLNHDGIINVSDIVNILEYALNLTESSGYIRCVSDINTDDIINIQDIIILVFTILGE